MQILVFSLPAVFYKNSRYYTSHPRLRLTIFVTLGLTGGICWKAVKSFSALPNHGNPDDEDEDKKENAARAARRAASYAKWSALPEERPSLAEVRKMKGNKFGALNADADAAARIGLTKAQRCSHLQRAAERGDTVRVKALLEAGADVDMENEYGQSPLFLAAWAGHPEVVAALVSYGADIAKASNGGATPAVAAASMGQEDVLRTLRKACPQMQSFQAEIPWRGTGSMTQIREGLLTRLPSTPAAGDSDGIAFYIDDAFEDAFLRDLEALWRSLPVTGREADPGKARSEFERSVTVADRSRQDAAPRRSYFCDVQGWLTSALAAVLQGARAPAISSNGKDEIGKAYAHMRFLHYADEGGFLPAHTDLARAEAGSGLKSTHTFLLYLSEPGEGGETVLLESLDAEARPLAIVKPVRGRLLVYPHACPHRAAAVLAPPKLLLRGEMR